MYRLFSSILTILLLGGCASIDGFISDPNRDSFAAEKQALFDQAYIDPLTDYLIEYHGDNSREKILRQVRQERDARCQEVARQYAGEPTTRRALERFNTGYAYSCPQQVAAFEERLNQLITETPPEPDVQDNQPSQAVNTKADKVSETAVSDQALSDCYLLTTIRNFSAARDACTGPAENGDIRAQANMAQVAYAFEDYTSAHEWAEKAAPSSGDAAFLLGQMYANGHGVSRNTDRAVYWYKEAVRQGHEKAQAALDSQSGGLPAGNN